MAYEGPNTYWGEPVTDEERELVEQQQNRALFTCVTGLI
jgi:hypothetical protein